MRTPLAVLAAASLVAASAVFGAVPAQAAVACAKAPITDVFTDPGTIVLGTSKAKDIEIIAVVKNSCKVTSAKVKVSSPVTSATFALDKGATIKDETGWGLALTLGARDLKNAEAGTWKATATAQSDSASTGFKVLREAKVTADASPEPVKKGKTITVKGTLQRADWEKGRFTAYGTQKVALQFQPAKGSFKTVKSVKGSSKGALSTTVKATKDGCFRYVFAGTATTAKVTSKADCIDVR